MKTVKLMIGALLLSCSIAMAGNWAGYACTDGPFPGSKGAFSKVSGRLTVPQIYPTSDWRALDIWLGMDGYGSRTVEQIGIECVWSAGQIGYYLWWEMYPKQPTFEWDFPISAGDVLLLSVTHSGSTFTLRCVNESKGVTFTKTASSKKGDRSSVEWIAEDTTWPVCPFDPIVWTDCEVVMRGQMLSLGSIPRQDGFSQVGAVSVGPIGTDGRGFTMTYQGN
jgi:hypothetical protein